MKKSYKVKVNQSADKSEVVNVSADKAQATKITAIPGSRYQLIDNDTGLAPDNVRAKRIGKDLAVSFEGRSEPDLLITDYYENTATGFNALIGEAESGAYHAYIPESANGATSIGVMADGSGQIGMALGGEQIQASGAAVGALVAAAGFNPLWALPLALLGAAGGGGGSSAAAVVTVPKITQAKLHPTDDTGISNTDNITGDNTPRIVVDADAGATVTVKINGKEYAGKEVSAGHYEIPVTDALPDGLRTFDVVAKNAAGGTTTFSGTQFVVDTSSANNYVAPDQTKPTTDPNNGIAVTIKSITSDTGSSSSDFYTSDNTLDYSGTVGSFTNNGDMVELHLLDASGKVLASEYVLPDSGQWNWKLTTSMPALVLADGKYTITAQVVDKAGNAVSLSPASQIIYVDTDGSKNQPDGTTDPNAKAIVDITAITTDSGVSPNDFLTNDKTLTYSGTVTGFTANGDKVMLELLNSSKTVIASNYVDATVNGTTGSWKWAYETEQADGQYTLKATLVDKAGNRVNANGAQDIQDLTIKSAADPDNQNKNASVHVTGITTDSGFNAADFITNDQTLTYSGTVKGFTANGDQVMLELLDSKQAIIATKYTDDIKSSQWTWDYQQTQTDGIYTIRATIVDKMGNRVNTASGGQHAQELTIKTTPTTNELQYGISISKLNEDTGYSSSDYLTNSQTVSFSGVIGNYNSDFSNSNIQVYGEILDTNGKVVAAHTMTVDDKGHWSFDKDNNLSLGASGFNTQYLFKASIFDSTGNIIKTTDHSFIIDLIKPDYKFKTDGQNDNIFTGLKFRGSENGYFTINGQKFLAEYEFNNSYYNKLYPTETFTLLFNDISGNAASPEANATNPSPWDLSNPFTLAHDSVNEPTTFSGNEVVGSIGKYVLAADVPVYDLANLHLTIPVVDSNQKAPAVCNHVDLSNGAHTLNLSTSDVLALGVTNSFSLANTKLSDGYTQLRIDGDLNDTVNLDNLIGNKTYDWNLHAESTPIKIGNDVYNSYRNEDFHLEVLIKQNITIHLV